LKAQQTSGGVEFMTAHNDFDDIGLLVDALESKSLDEASDLPFRLNI
jgi:hypothetical protein